MLTHQTHQEVAMARKISKHEWALRHKKGRVKKAGGGANARQKGVSGGSFLVGGGGGGGYAGGGYA